MTATGKIAVIIVNRNGLGFLSECLPAVQAQTWRDTMTIVADNGSSDGSQEYVRKNFPQMQLLEFWRNTGFAYPNNRAIGHAMAQGAKYFLLLNNDVTLHPDALERLMECMGRHPLTGAAAPVQYRADKPEEVLSAGGHVDLRRGLVIHDRSLPNDCEETGFVSGAAFFVSAKAIAAAGMMDESYFFYGEDADFSLRIKRAGFELRRCPQARCLHKAQGSSSNAVFRVYHMTRTRLMLESRMASPKEKAYFAAFFLRNTLLGEYRSLRRAGRPELARALLDGVADWWRGRISERYIHA